MNDNEIEYLEKALNNDNNENITNLSFKDVNEKKEHIFKELKFNKSETKKMLKKLEDYRYIDELPELQEGRYIRWINITNPDNLRLTNGGVLCEIKIEDSIILLLKNNINRIFQVDMDKALIFQRFSLQEKVILYALDYVNKP